MMILLNPVDPKGVEYDDVGFNTDLMVSIRNFTHLEDRVVGMIEMLNGEKIYVSQQRKEIVKRINELMSKKR